MTPEVNREIAAGERFGFGANWTRYSRLIAEERIRRAEETLTHALGSDGVRGRSFLDAGSGSGLFSLAAMRLGARRVHSFDYDPASVACAEDLRRRFFPDTAAWTIERGDVLAPDYLAPLGTFDIVYSWGVLHHTGQMWQAIANVLRLVAPGGVVWIAIYNDQGRASGYWRAVKRLYNRLPRGLKWLVLGPAACRLWGPTTIRDIVRGQPFRTWKSYQSVRGMSPWRDVVDWVGGYPFEVATPEEIFRFCRDRGFVLRDLKTCGGGHGCNEFVFARAAEPGLPESERASSLQIKASV